MIRKEITAEIILSAPRAAVLFQNYAMNEYERETLAALVAFADEQTEKQVTLE